MIPAWVSVLAFDLAGVFIVLAIGVLAVLATVVVMVMRGYTVVIKKEVPEKEEKDKSRAH